MDKESLLLSECQKVNNVERVADLLKQGADINTVNEKYGAGVLHYAAKYSDKNMIEFLLADKKISVNVMDNDSKTPLIYACKKAKKY